MAGQATFRAAVEALVSASIEVCRSEGIEPAAVDLFVFHQANARILASVGGELDVPDDRIVNAIALVGNTFPGARVLLAGVGAGFTC
jgi:3-oxoacyl-[acyl-carrier-protein] synthase-3